MKTVIAMAAARNHHQAERRSSASVLGGRSGIVAAPGSEAASSMPESGGTGLGLGVIASAAMMRHRPRFPLAGAQVEPVRSRFDFRLRALVACRGPREGARPGTGEDWGPGISDGVTDWR